MRKIKRAAAFTLAAILAATMLLLSGCSTTSDEINLAYPFSGNIDSYDPQVAASADEFLLIENCFEGLVRCDDDGNITPGCAESWEISDDALTYTFHLYKGLRWCIYDSVSERMGEDWNPEITAADFVFALQRAADKDTECPLYSTISHIKNASKVHAGKASASKLGVKATDDYTLQITLSSKDNNFLETLSTAVAMPCNKEFFNATNGRYGLELKYTMFNGQFIISNELDSSYILRKNSAYTGTSPAEAVSLTLNIVEKDTDVTDKLLSGYYDAAYIRGYQSGVIGDDSGITLTPYSNITWVMLINSNSENEILAEKKARQALTLALSDVDLTELKYLTNATGIIPPSCTAKGTPYTEAAKAVTKKSDEDKAVTLWKDAVSDSGIYTANLEVLVPEGMEDTVKRLLQGIEGSIGNISNVNSKDLTFNLKLNTLSESEVKSTVSSGTWDIAIYPLEAESDDAVYFLQSLNDGVLAGLSTGGFEAALNSALDAGTKTIVSKCRDCEKAIVNSYCVCPLFFETNYYAEAAGITGVQFHAGTGRVSFVGADAV